MFVPETPVDQLPSDIDGLRYGIYSRTTHPFPAHVVRGIAAVVLAELTDFGPLYRIDGLFEQTSVVRFARRLQHLRDRSFVLFADAEELVVQLSAAVPDVVGGRGGEDGGAGGVEREARKKPCREPRFATSAGKMGSAARRPSRRS